MNPSSFAWSSFPRKEAFLWCMIMSLLSSIDNVQSTPLELQEMFAKIEQDTYTFAHAYEDMIIEKCNFSSDDTCYKRSYHDCDSELPAAECPGNEYAVAKCGSGKEGGCGGLFDFTASVVRIAPDTSNSFFGSATFEQPDNDRIRDGVCTTLQMDQYMKDATKDSKSYWESYEVSPPWYHIGTDEGIFRIFPGRPGSCPNNVNSYDPRVRPWYVAASSGPKDIILVLDTSGSMRDYGRISIMKDAAKRVINTLGASDYFQVIRFSGSPSKLGRDSLLVRATAENKKHYITLIDKLDANGGTKFSPAFDMAFDTFQDSRKQDRTSSCHKAILFLSDGEILFNEESELYEKIQSGRAVNTDNGENAPIIFTYSLGSASDDRVLKEIACRNDGIWAKIEDGGDLAKSMGAYYKYFAYGLGDQVNQNFVAWVEPYEFATGVGMGITASAPVFDRNQEPPVLAGVVGLDLSLSALERAFGEDLSDESRDKVIQLVIQRSTAVCPVLELTPCQLESLRQFGSDDTVNEDALCKKCNTTISSLKAPLCSKYSKELFDNINNKGRSYEERACCTVGLEPGSEDKICVEKAGPNFGLIVALSVTFGLLGVVTLMIVSRRIRRRKAERQKQEERWSSINQEIKPLENDVVVMAHPSAPPMAN